MDRGLDALVRRVDEDRWLASRFAPRLVRARLIALYALHYEIARTAEVVSEPGVGAVRLQWWREALTEMAEGGGPRAHPVLQALAGTQMAPAIVGALIAAHEQDFVAAPFRAWAGLDAYLDATAGSVMGLAAALCEAAAPEEFIRAAGRAWGALGLLRAEPHWRARGRSFLPQDGGSLAELLQRAQGSYAEARESALASSLFPAVGYLALAPNYARALARGRYETPLFMRQIRLVAAAATGRL